MVAVCDSLRKGIIKCCRLGMFQWLSFPELTFPSSDKSDNPIVRKSPLLKVDGSRIMTLRSPKRRRSEAISRELYPIVNKWHGSKLPPSLQPSERHIGRPLDFFRVLIIQNRCMSWFRHSRRIRSPDRTKYESRKAIRNPSFPIVMLMNPRSGSFRTCWIEPLG